MRLIRCSFLSTVASVQNDIARTLAAVSGWTGMFFSFIGHHCIGACALDVKQSEIAGPRLAGWSLQEQNFVVAAPGWVLLVVIAYTGSCQRFQRVDVAFLPICHGRGVADIDLPVKRY